MLSALEDLFSSHVGSVADGGEGKKRELGRNKPDVIFRILPGHARHCHLSRWALGWCIVQTFLRKTTTLEGRGATLSRISRAQFSSLWAFNILTHRTVSSQHHRRCLIEPVTFAGTLHLNLIPFTMAWHFLYQALGTAQPRHLSPFFLGGAVVVSVKLC